MRIGIMLRTLNEKGGVSVYSHNILHELLRLDQRNHYVLFYQHRRHLGTYARRSNVTEVVVPGTNKIYWDQIAIPLACRRHQLDLLFHPKFTVPFLAPCPTVMTVHGADWFIPEQAQYYTWLDVRYVRAVMPWYFRKATAVISVSQLTTDNFNRVLDLPPDKVQTIYFAPARHFRPIDDPAELATVRAKYALPERFILTLTKLLGDGRKNLPQIFKAYAHYHQQAANPAKLVVGGKDCHQFRAKYSLPDDGYGADIHFPDWIDQADLPAVHALAALYLYPSNLEAFPIPLTEAMACGTPIVTSNVNGLAEIAGDAAVLVNPRSTEEIANAVARVLADPELQRDLSARGLARSRRFSWDACARDTLALFERAARVQEAVHAR